MVCIYWAYLFIVSSGINCIFAMLYLWAISFIRNKRGYPRQLCKDCSYFVRSSTHRNGCIIYREKIHERQSAFFPGKSPQSIREESMIKDNIKFFFGEQTTCVIIGLIVWGILILFGVNQIIAAGISLGFSHWATRKIGVMHHRRGCSHHELL